MFRDIFFFIFILIFIFLLVNNGDKTTSIISSLASGFNTSIKNLQGRG